MGAQEAASSGSWLDVVSAWGSVLGAVFALAALIVTAVYGEIQRRGQKRAQESQNEQLGLAREGQQNQEEQLRLAREQADARPKLRVIEVRLGELDEAPALKKHLEPFRKARDEKVRWERTREAREERQRQREREMSPEQRRLHAEADRVSREFSIHLAATSPPSSIPFHETPGGYVGPIPNKILFVTLANDGKEAAYEVAGWLRLEASRLEPARKFSSPNTTVSAGDKVHRVKVGGTEKDTLHPTRAARLHFRIAVAVHSPGTTRIEYDFTPAVGDGDRGHETLEVASSE